jgi:hypothetical protein
MEVERDRNRRVPPSGRAVRGGRQGLVRLVDPLGIDWGGQIGAAATPWLGLQERRRDPLRSGSTTATRTPM